MSPPPVGGPPGGVPLLVRAVLVAVALAPLPASADPAPTDPVDVGDAPTRTARTAAELVIAVEGSGATVELARADAHRRRDEAIVAAVRGQAHALQVQGPADAGGVWPGSDGSERVLPGDGEVRVALEVRIADVGPLTAIHDASGVRIAWRLLPRRGAVVVGHDPDVQGFLPGDVLDEALGVAGLRDAIASGTPVRVVRGGAEVDVVPVRVARAAREDVIRLAPTCGPCCHGHCDDDRIKPWDVPLRGD